MVSHFTFRAKALRVAPSMLVAIISKLCLRIDASFQDRYQGVEFTI
jgi:hypothetical protein